jgi:CRISPR-associated endonuclease Csn1
VERKKYGMPVIICNTEVVWDKIIAATDGFFPQTFIDNRPPVNCTIELSLQQNEMFVLGLDKPDVELAIAESNYEVLTDSLYRVQKLSIKPSSGQIDFYFRHHLETAILDDNNAKLSKRFINIQSLGSLMKLQPYKVKINHLGQILQPTKQQ